LDEQRHYERQKKLRELAESKIRATAAVAASAITAPAAADASKHGLKNPPNRRSSSNLSLHRGTDSIANPKKSLRGTTPEQQKVVQWLQGLMVDMSQYAAAFFDQGTMHG
jgi:hypothetical protein